MAGVGGYDYEFVTTLPDRLICKICHNPCRDAHLTSCCGAHFCRSCLQQVRRGRSVSRACPMCRAERFQSFQNKEANREIKALKVYCQNSSNGCTWSGEVNDVKSHVDNDCQFVDMPCPSNCGMILKRQRIKSHLTKDCPCHCQYCGFTGHKMEIATRHKKHCSQYPLTCPNGCEVGVIPSIGMAAHRIVCPLELVYCDYYDVGCCDTMVRKELEDHYNQRMAEHLSLMKLKLASTVEEFTKSENKLASIGKQLQVTKRALDDTRVEYDKLTENYDELTEKYDRLTDRISTNEYQLNRVTDEHPVARTDLHDVGATMRMQHEQDMKLNFITTFFTKHNSLMVVVIILFLISYIVESSTANHRLSQIEEQMWHKSLDDLSELSMSNDSIFTPFTFKMCEVTDPMVNFTFFPFNDEFETLLTMMFYREDNLKKNLSVSLSFNRSDLHKTDVKRMLTIELLNQLHNDDHYISPMILDLNRYHPEPCKLSDDDTITCAFHFITIEDLARKREQYLQNRCLYIRISHTRLNMMMWYAYAFCGPSILNTMLDYRPLVTWIIIGMLVLSIILINDSWYISDHFKIYAFTFILFLSYAELMANKYFDLLD